MDKTITLKNVKVVFVSLEDEGFGKSITIDATDKDIKDAITKWVKDNKIGKKTPGVPNFKEYEGKQQYAFKINDFTRFGGVGDLTKNDIGFGSTVTLEARAYEYDNKFGKATSFSLEAVVVMSRALTGSDDTLARLMNEVGDQSVKEIQNEPSEDTIDINSIPF